MNNEKIIEAIKQLEKAIILLDKDENKVVIPIIEENLSKIKKYLNRINKQI